jgi:hypothetical protein
MAINTDTVVQDIFTVWATQAGPTNWQWDDLAKAALAESVPREEPSPTQVRRPPAPELPELAPLWAGAPYAITAQGEPEELTHSDVPSRYY